MVESCRSQGPRQNGVILFRRRHRDAPERSGEIGFVSGTYELTMNDASGNPVNDRGKYLEVWEKQPDGSWKCGADIWNSDLSASAPAAPERRRGRAGGRSHRS